MGVDAVVVTLCDRPYYDRMKTTIRDVRSRGRWTGSFVVITVGFTMDAMFRDFYEITEVQFPRIDTDALVRSIGEPFPGWDGREFTKRVQWEKLHVFDDYFRQWDRVVFLDAGLRILAPIERFLSLDSRGKILAHHDNGSPDAPHRGTKRFGEQLFFGPGDAHRSRFISEFGEPCLEAVDYFLNCFWIYDTEILNVCTKDQLIDLMNAYPIWKSNEMGVMNTLFHFRHKLWEPLPFVDKTTGKIWFEWSESTQPSLTGTWRDFCALKYPVTLRLTDP